MISDFQQSKYEVSGHLVTVTSWYDDLNRTWSAGAPAYKHIFTGEAHLPTGYTTRQAAIDRIKSILTGHFNDRR